eukprot:TRINITY_DN19182_c0_g1_i1.p1 TRINITY_DN19182_c0_g1~~TRINITY_DN19182_c0_g1_i1.p1  ORF type:complete len:333 (+),score=60.50 TRINITY_DN19182_c0_g1_i1:109-1107(+)
MPRKETKFIRFLRFLLSAPGRQPLPDFKRLERKVRLGGQPLDFDAKLKPRVAPFELGYIITRDEGGYKWDGYTVEDGAVELNHVALFDASGKFAYGRVSCFPRGWTADDGPHFEALMDDYLAAGLRGREPDVIVARSPVRVSKRKREKEAAEDARVLRWSDDTPAPAQAAAASPSSPALSTEAAVDSAEPSPAPFEGLPDEMLVLIFSNVSVRELGVLSRVSRRMRRLANEEVLWQRLYEAGTGRQEKVMPDWSWNQHVRQVTPEFLALLEIERFLGAKPGPDNELLFLAVIKSEVATKRFVPASVVRAHPVASQKLLDFLLSVVKFPKESS